MLVCALRECFLFSSVLLPLPLSVSHSLCLCLSLCLYLCLYLFVCLSLPLSLSLQIFSSAMQHCANCHFKDWSSEMKLTKNYMFIMLMSAASFIRNQLACVNNIKDHK